MIWATEIMGLDVIDGSGEKLGSLEDVDFTLPDYNSYLRIRGPKMGQIRNRRDEYLPLTEIARISENVELYSGFNEIVEKAGEIDMEKMENYSLSTLRGREITTLDREVLGEVVDIGFSENKKTVYYRAAGPNVEGLRGNQTEDFPISQIDDMADTIQININYGDLKRKISQGRDG